MSHIEYDFAAYLLSAIEYHESNGYPGIRLALSEFYGVDSGLMNPPSISQELINSLLLGFGNIGLNSKFNGESINAYLGVSNAFEPTSRVRADEAAKCAADHLVVHYALEQAADLADGITSRELEAAMQSALCMVRGARIHAVMDEAMAKHDSETLSAAGATLPPPPFRARRSGL